MEGVAVKSSRGKLTNVWAHRVCAILLAGITFASVASAQQLTAGEKGRVKGKIVARYGARVEVEETKTGSLAGDPQGRALDQRVDVKLIVNKGLGGM
jgi:F0F1-type ATP synthase delta subunit